MAVRLNTTTYQPPKHLAKFESDLASLMMFIADVDDYVVAKQPDYELLNFWFSDNNIPHFCNYQEAKKLIQRGYNLEPWGQCRQIYHQFGDIDNFVKFDEKSRELHSRLSSHLLEKQISNEYNSISERINDIEKAQKIIEKSNCVLKSLWSSSGRGVIIVNDNKHCLSATTWAKDKIESEGSIIIEKYLKRVCEFSFLFKIDNNIKYIGLNYFEADEAGRFGHELIGFNPMKNVGFDTDWDLPIANQLIDAMHQLHWEEKYNGNIGIDAMAYIDDNDKIKIRPCTEANIRTCMGNINNSISKHFAEGTIAKWQIERFESDNEWNYFCAEQSAKYPIKRNEIGLITSGFFRLTSLDEKMRFGAWGKTID